MQGGGEGERGNGKQCRAGKGGKRRSESEEGGSKQGRGRGQGRAVGRPSRAWEGVGAHQSKGRSKNQPHP